MHDQPSPRLPRCPPHATPSTSTSRAGIPLVARDLAGARSPLPADRRGRPAQLDGEGWVPACPPVGSAGGTRESMSRGCAPRQFHALTIRPANHDGGRQMSEDLSEKSETSLQVASRHSASRPCRLAAYPASKPTSPARDLRSRTQYIADAHFTVQFAQCSCAPAVLTGLPLVIAR